MRTLQASLVCVKRAGRAILDDVSLRAEGGAFVAVIGPNGAGKSTLLMALAGLLKPDSGTIMIDDRALSVFSRWDLARTRSYLPQNPHCEWPISVARLVALGLTPSLPVFGDLPEAHRRRVGAVIAAFDLTGLSEQAATTLSGGELTRAMLARALVSDPDILIVDEPVAGLDPRHTLDTVRRLSGLAKSGKLVIAAVHDLTLAARYATRVLALHHGRVAADGPPETTLNTDLLRQVFQVEARIGGVAGGAFVDYLAPAGERSQ